jgi:hypothetical protein
METVLEKQRHSILHLCFQLKRLNFEIEIAAVNSPWRPDCCLREREALAAAGESI